ncbi:MAG: DNA polymerase III subunit delta [Muribaculaceae bacterium]|nr:DNA polymerase III subunit delta [Muribaculaceae bacterium]MDE5929051.1 DNA polymerase III subunit delta [Muribaculaceae bacterium]
MALTFDALRTMLSARQYKPVYLLHGEEGFYIDRLVSDFEKIIPEDERDFNLHVFYAPRVEPDTVMSVCRQAPFGVERQVVILKEAQALRADELNKYHSYVESPNPQTIFVICCRGEKAKGKDLMAASKKPHVEVFETKKLWDSQIRPEIVRCLGARGLQADQKAVEMLAQHIGTDLSRLYNEIGKLADILPPRAKVTPEIIEEYIGVSKDYNVFELIDALAVKDSRRVFTIVNAFRSNPKANPTIPMTSSLFTYFSDLMILHYTPDKSERSVMAALKLKAAVQAKRYIAGLQNYNAFKVIEIIHALRDFDCRVKGNGSRRDEYQLFHELMYHILTAPGTLPV